MLLYGLTVFAGAFLLFEVQPLIAKMILPWFGGSAAVWVTCLLFFQSALLLGYFYAFWLVGRFRPRVQAQVHMLLLALSLLVLPIVPHEAWKPTGSEDPAPRILGLLGVTVGLPYVLLSATSPLLQAWYAQSHQDARPYRLFAVSNVASLLALAAYPLLVEPIFSSRRQAVAWSVAYLLFAFLCAVVAIGQWGARRRATTHPKSQRRESMGTLSPAPTDVPGPGRVVQALWVALAACGSALLLAITHHLSQNVAAIPLLWVLPLSLYLASFVLCFQSRSRYRRDLFLRLLAVALGGMGYALAPESVNARLALLIPLYCVGLFVCCMCCHGELERLKPDPAYLTSFYLMIALGGALGAAFVGLAAPHLFRGFFELPLSMASCAVLMLIVLRHDPASAFYQARWQPTWLVLIGLTVLYIASLSLQIGRDMAQTRLMARNFYAGLRIRDFESPRIVLIGGAASGKLTAASPPWRKLTNGTIDHGLQFLSPDGSRRPTTYYGPRSGVGLALAEAGRRPGLQVGVIGLGTGTLATYGRPGDHYTFYELNPLVIRLAETEFTFLADSQAKIDVVPGDARLSLEREPVQHFDVLAVDAFSGDSIPVHLLTREALALYFRHLKEGGVLAVHITNRYVNLQPVVGAAAESLGKRAVVISNERDERNKIFRAVWVLISAREGFFDEPEIRKAGRPPQRRPNLRIWTDEYSNLLGVLKR